MWLALPVWLRLPWVFVGSTALAGMVVLGGELLDGSAGVAFALGESIVVPFGAGLLVWLVARRLEGPNRRAWLTIGAGVMLRGAGEVAWQTLFLSGGEVSYPNVADALCLISYPVILLGVLLLPYLRPRRWERARLTIDAIAGSFAMTAILWIWYLENALYNSPGIGFLGRLANLAYPVGDLILLMSVLILATRRSAYRFDGRLVALGMGLVVLTANDVSYILQLGAATVNVADPRVGLSYGATGLGLLFVALVIASPVRPRDLADRPSRLWPLVVPYMPVLALFALTIGRIGDQVIVLQAASVIVAVLVMTRQGVAIRETRDVVERQRNNLVASVSHELRTPLTSVSGFVQILHENPDLDRDERIEIVGIIASQTQYLNHAVSDLVQVAHGRISRIDLASQDLAVSDLVAFAIDMLADDAPAAGITTRIEPGLVVRADRHMLHQVLLKYLSNAARYGRGTIEVHATGTPDGVLIETHDNGPGVPKKYELSIWDRFERGVHANLSQVQGSGLGLPIVRDLVAAHHGDSGYRPSERLGGACFWFTIPSSHRHKHPAQVVGPDPSADPLTYRIGTAIAGLPLARQGAHAGIIDTG